MKRKAVGPPRAGRRLGVGASSPGPSADASFSDKATNGVRRPRGNWYSSQVAAARFQRGRRGSGGARRRRDASRTSRARSGGCSRRRPATWPAPQHASTSHHSPPSMRTAFHAWPAGGHASRAPPRTSGAGDRSSVRWRWPPGSVRGRRRLRACRRGWHERRWQSPRRQCGLRRRGLCPQRQRRDGDGIFLRWRSVPRRPLRQAAEGVAAVAAVAALASAARRVRTDGTAEASIPDMLYFLLLFFRVWRIRVRGGRRSLYVSSRRRGRGRRISSLGYFCARLQISFSVSAQPQRRWLVEPGCAWHVSAVNGVCGYCTRRRTMALEYGDAPVMR